MEDLGHKLSDVKDEPDARKKLNEVSAKFETQKAAESAYFNELEAAQKRMGDKKTEVLDAMRKNSNCKIAISGGLLGGGIKQNESINLKQVQDAVDTCLEPLISAEMSKEANAEAASASAVCSAQTSAGGSAGGPKGGGNAAAAPTNN